MPCCAARGGRTHDVAYRSRRDTASGRLVADVFDLDAILYAIAHGSKAAREALRLDPQTIAVSGLAVAFLAGLAGLIPGDAIFTGQWLFLGATEGDKGLPLSTILVFDLGVYLVVLGAVLTLVFALEEEV